MSETNTPDNGHLCLDLKDDGAFPEIDEARWRALVDTALKGADFDRRLVKKTADGLAVKPLYQASDSLPDTGLPGQMPFTRGSHAAADLTRPWDITLRVDHPDLKRANAIIIEGLEGGVSHVELVIADHAQSGLTIESKDDMAVLLAGVDLSLISISICGGEEAGNVARLVAMLGGPKVVTGSIGLDPLGTLATRGGLATSLEDALSMAGFYALKTSEMTDTFRTMSVDLRGYDAAGASPALSLAIAMATGTAYLRALEAGGLSIDDAAKQISFTLTTDTDLFGSIAKLRAARALWARIVTACGGSEAAAGMRLWVETAATTMTQRDPHMNILRTAIASFGAALGGANAISILPFTHALGLPNELARRIARNIHVLLDEESHLGQVMDPAGGSFALEAMTQELGEAAWALFQKMEELGGMGEALTSGWIAAKLKTLGDAQRASVAKRKTSITGVSEFPDLGEIPVGTEDASQREIAEPTFAVTAPALTPMRHAAPFEALRDKADAHAASSGKRPSIFLANIGTPSDFTARAAFARNLFESGGIEAVGEAGFTSAEDAVAAFAKSGAAIACLCSSDTLYKEHGAAFAAALGGAGAKKLYLAGNPGDGRTAFEEAGITGFIFMGTNVLEALEEAQSTIGIAS